MDEEKKDPILTVKDGGLPSREDIPKFLGGFFDLNGNNFLGSGMSYFEWSRTSDFLRYERCLITQTREEKARRMKYLVRMAAEQERIEAQDIFATRWSQACIEAVIEGDWNAVEMWTKELTFEKEHPHIKELAARRFVKFVEIAKEALDTRPKIFCPVCRKPPDETKLNGWSDGRHVCTWCDVVFDDNGNFEQTGRARLRPVEGGS